MGEQEPTQVAVSAVEPGQAVEAVEPGYVVEPGQAVEAGQAVEPGYVVEPGPIRPPRDGRAVRRRLAVLGGVFVVAAGVVGLALAGTGRLGPPAPRLPPRVALVDPAGALAIVDARGATLESHALAGTTFLFPAWSPDGTQVAAVGLAADAGSIEVFAEGRASGAAGSSSVAPTSSSEGTVVYRSATSSPFYVYWTPDGRGITFLTSETAGGIALRAAPADGSAPATVVRSGAPMYWAWADPGRMLVHTGGDDAGAFLGEVATDGTTVRSVAQPPGQFRSPAVTADGRFEAYEVSEGKAGAAVVVAARNGSTSHEVPVFGPAAMGFSPAGDQLAFLAATAPDTAPAFPFGPLRVVDPRSGAVRTLVDGRALGFFWSPDGRTIAALVLPPPSGPGAASRAGVPSIAAAGTGRATAILAATDLLGFDLTLEFVDVASGTVRSGTTVRVTPLFTSQVLPFFDQYALSHRFWSPDSASFLLPVVAADGNEVLEALPADGSPPRVLAAGSIGSWSP